MKKSIARQLMIVLAVFSYVAQAGAVVATHGMVTAGGSHAYEQESTGPESSEGSAAGTVSDQFVQGHGHLDNQYLDSQNQVPQDVQPGETHQPHSGDDDCIQQCDCSTGHCFSAALLSGDTSLAFNLRSTQPAYTGLFSTTPLKSLFKPPIFR